MSLSMALGFLSGYLYGSRPPYPRSTTEGAPILMARKGAFTSYKEPKNTTARVISPSKARESAELLKAFEDNAI